MFPCFSNHREITSGTMDCFTWTKMFANKIQKSLLISYRRRNILGKNGNSKHMNETKISLRDSFLRTSTSECGDLTPLTVHLHITSMSI
eukprot:UN00459